MARVRNPWTLLWLEVGEFKPEGLAGPQARRTGLSLKVTVSASPHADDISPILKRLANYDLILCNVSIGTSSTRSVTLHFVYFSFSRLAEDYSRLGEILENKIPLDTAIYRLLSRKRNRTEVARMLLQIDDLPQEIKVVALSSLFTEFFGGEGCSSSLLRESISTGALGTTPASPTGKS